MSTRTKTNGALVQLSERIPHRPSLAARIGHACWMLLLTFLAWRMRRATEGRLMSLDDRMLKDIGIDRSEIGSMVRNGREGRGGHVRHVPYY